MAESDAARPLLPSIRQPSFDLLIEAATARIQTEEAKQVASNLQETNGGTSVCLEPTIKKEQGTGQPLGVLAAAAADDSLTSSSEQDMTADPPSHQTRSINGAGKESFESNNLENADGDLLEHNTASNKKNKADLLKAAKALSNDPLVQLSMLRAMQQQQVPPDVVWKNKEEREKSIEARQRKSSAKRVKSNPRSPQMPVKKANTSAVNPPSQQASPSKPISQDNSPSSLTTKDNTVTHQADHPAVIPREMIHNEMQQYQVAAPIQLPPQSQPQAAAAPALSDPNMLLQTLNFMQALSAATQVSQQQPNPYIHQMALAQMLQSNPAVAQLLALFGNTGFAQPFPQNPMLGAGGDLPFFAPATNAAVNSDRVGQNETNAAQGSVTNGELKDMIRIPCRARGMPSSHSFETAHFLVPHDVAHGQDLICSYPACRAGGVRFRYCRICRIPVAKRNFRLRHSHSETGAITTLDEMKVPSTICVSVNSNSSQSRQALPTGVENSETLQPPTQRSSDEEEDEEKSLPNANPTVTGHQHAVSPNDPSNREKALSEGSQSLDQVASGNDSASPTTPEEHYVEIEKKETDNILTLPKPSVNDRKPFETDLETNPKKRSRNVFSSRLDVEHDVALAKDREQSEAGIVIREERAYKLKNISKKRLLLWSNLLGARPNKQDDSSMATWLMQVLKVSDLNIPLKDDTMSSPSSLSLSDAESGGEKEIAGATHSAE